MPACSYQTATDSTTKQCNFQSLLAQALGGLDRPGWKQAWHNPVRVQFIADADQALAKWRFEEALLRRLAGANGAATWLYAPRLKAWAGMPML